jgi:hypothetical protein
MDRDSYFVPAGYDWISILKNFDIQNELQLLYEERVPYVKPKNVIKEEEVVCEDVNLFLKRFVDKGKKVEGVTRRANLTEYATEENKPNNYSTEDRNSIIKNTDNSNDIKDNFTSNGKSVNFEIFNNVQKGKNQSIDLNSGTSGITKPTTTSDRLVRNLI